jgi:hypothetical protein
MSTKWKVRVSIPVGVRFSSLFLTILDSDPTFYAMGTTMSFQGVTLPGGALITYPHLVPRVKRK